MTHDRSTANPEAAPIRISKEPAESLDAQRLLAALDAELRQRYPNRPQGQYDGDLADGRGDLLVARDGKQALGCAALRLFEPGVGEVKRMYVAPAARGMGLGRRLLGAVEELARNRRLTLLRLETGALQPEALALYAEAGYQRIASYAEFDNDPHSVCLEKRLNEK